MSDKADWQGVGESFRTLGRHLRDKAVDAGGAVKDAGSQAENGVADSISAAFSTAMDKIDQTTSDPEVATAAKSATARFLDALKAELTGEGPTPPPAAPTSEPPAAG